MLRLVLGLCLSAALFAQPQTPAANPAPDTLIFTNGEKLIGHFERSLNGKVTFKSDSIGEVQVDWSKIQELHTSQNFAVINKSVRTNRRSDLEQVPQGPVTVTNQTVSVAPPAPAPPVTMPVGQVGEVLDQPTFQNSVLHDPGIFGGWIGTVTAGATVVQATQQSRSFTGAVNLVRTVPSESFLPPRNRTSLNFTGSEGFLVQPNTPKIKTEILHADAERDQYFDSKAVFAFGQAMFDHNFSLGLDLQQVYAGGIGWTAIQRANETLDIKGSMAYERQAFQVASLDQNLISSVFSEDYLRRFGRGMQFTQLFSVTPSWNDLNAYAATGSAALNVPVYKRLSFTTSILDTFLNNPPPGFKKNSFQFTTGLTYSLR